MGVRHPNSRGHAKAWESVTQTQGTTPRRASLSAQLEGPRGPLSLGEGLPRFGVAPLGSLTSYFSFCPLHGTLRCLEGVGRCQRFCTIMFGSLRPPLLCRGGGARHTHLTLAFVRHFSRIAWCGSIQIRLNHRKLATHVPPVPSIEQCKREQYSSITGGNFGGYPARCVRYALVGSLSPF